MLVCRTLLAVRFTSELECMVELGVFFTTVLRGDLIVLEVRSGTDLATLHGMLLLLTSMSSSEKKVSG